MNEEQIKSKITQFMASGLSRDRAFHKFNSAQWKAIIEWEQYIEGLSDRFGNPLPDEWQGVYSSVTAAVARERAAVKLAEQIEASDWDRPAA